MVCTHVKIIVHEGVVGEQLRYVKILREFTSNREMTLKFQK